MYQFRGTVAGKDMVRRQLQLRAQRFPQFQAARVGIGSRVNAVQGFEHSRGRSQGIDIGAEIQDVSRRKPQGFQFRIVQSAMYGTGHIISRS